MKRFFLSLGSGVALFFFCGCSKAQLSDIPGKYVAKHPYGTESFELKSDHTYEQVLTSGQTSLTNKGQWVFHAPSDLLDRGGVGLKDALIHGDGRKRGQSAKTYWSVNVAIYPREVRLEHGDDVSFSRAR